MTRNFDLEKAVLTLDRATGKWERMVKVSAEGVSQDDIDEAKYQMDLAQLEVERLTVIPEISDSWKAIGDR